MEKACTFPYLEPCIGLSISRPRRNPLKMGFHLMIRKRIILRDPFPVESIVPVLFIRFCPLLIIILLLPNQQGNIFLRVIHGRFPLVLTILVIRKEITVPLQFTTRQ